MDTSAIEACISFAIDAEMPEGVKAREQLAELKEMESKIKEAINRAFNNGYNMGVGKPYTHKKQLRDIYLNKAK